jgi:hypothetical protein
MSEHARQKQFLLCRETGPILGLFMPKICFYTHKRTVDLMGKQQFLIAFEIIYSVILELVAKPHRHFFNVTMTQASWKKATNILI